jgi:small subunit ribosomal protein S5
VKDVLAKSMGSSNAANVVKATVDALSKLRTRTQILELRGKKRPPKAAVVEVAS